MGKKLTQEDFIQRALASHTILYDHSKVEYVNNYTNVEIICQKHGSFWMTPANYFAGQNCKDCAKNILIENSIKNFIEKSIKKFGDLIDHSLTEYNGYEEKAVLFCKIHGRFEVLPSTHLVSKHGCTTCGALSAPKLRVEKRKNSFLADAKAAHGDTYTYEKIKYENTKTPVEITCRIHGSFWQSPEKHRAGQGCYKCAKYGYNSSRPGNFYILSNGNITKVGITHKEVKERVHQINKSKKLDKFKIMTSMFYEDGSVPRKIETACLTYLRSKYQQVSEVFDGSTECFLDVDLNDLLQFVTPLSQDNTPIATQSELDNKPAISAQ